MNNINLNGLMHRTADKLSIIAMFIESARGSLSRGVKLNEQVYPGNEYTPEVLLKRATDYAYETATIKMVVQKYIVIKIIIFIG